MGVWIEMANGLKTPLIVASLPVWECGLKSHLAWPFVLAETVTPCVGVWIEIINFCLFSGKNPVTPCVGVWIEIFLLCTTFFPQLVTPCVGVWIEMSDKLENQFAKSCHSLCGSVD